jgi:predicted AAA+ superfamily ATPase
MINHEVVNFNKKSSIVQDPLMKPSISSIIGPTGSGKSTILLNYLMALQKSVNFQHALFVTANKKDVILEHIGDMEITNDPEVINDFINKIASMTKEEAKENPSILVMDDIQDNPLFDINRNKKLNRFVLDHRHHNLWVAFALQTYKNSLSSVLRRQTSLIFMFPPRNKAEEESIIKEQNVDANKLKRAFELARAQEHVPVYLNTQQQKARLYLGFNKQLEL